MTRCAVWCDVTYPLLSTGCDPVMRGAMGSLYTAVVPSTVTDTLTPKERGTEEKQEEQRQEDEGGGHDYVSK